MMDTMPVLTYELEKDAPLIGDELVQFVVNARGYVVMGLHQRLMVGVGSIITDFAGHVLSRPLIVTEVTDCSDWKEQIKLLAPKYKYDSRVIKNPAGVNTSSYSYFRAVPASASHLAEQKTRKISL